MNESDSPDANPGSTLGEGLPARSNGSPPEDSTAVTPEVILPGEDETLAPELRAWLASLGPGGHQLATEAAELIKGVGVIMGQAGEAFQANALARLEELERHAKVLNARVKPQMFPWARDFVRGGQRAVSALVHFNRGNRFITAWRHERAREELRISARQLEEGLQLLDSAIAEVPPVGVFGEIKREFPIAIHMLRQIMRLIPALEKQSGVEELLLLGRVDAYVEGVRALAQELAATSEGMLAAGSDQSMVLDLSGMFANLAESFNDRAEAIEEAQRGRAREIYVQPTGNKVFIIHGHAEEKWRELRTLLEERFKLKDRVVVLREEASQSKTVIEKFEEFANHCGYAIALVTPDDWVTKPEAQYSQARPNVLFEVGWFYGRFGPRRLLILKRKGTPLPSDLGGVVAIEFNEAVKECAVDIQDELCAAGVIT
jgi:predicted nucleotide-binding protein